MEEEHAKARDNHRNERENDDALGPQPIIERPKTDGGKTGDDVGHTAHHAQHTTTVEHPPPLPAQSRVRSVSVRVVPFVSHSSLTL